MCNLQFSSELHNISFESLQIIEYSTSGIEFDLVAKHDDAFMERYTKLCMACIHYYHSVFLLMDVVLSSIHEFNKSMLKELIVNLHY